MNSKKYNLAFTTGGLFQNESTQFVALYQELKDWDLVRENVISKNLLQMRKVRTIKHLSGEIILRLKQLSLPELELFATSDSQDQAYLLWVAICRRFRFVSEFATEIIREKSLSMRHDLVYADFDAFFDRKSESHPELEAITPATRNKLRQVLFRILREAGLLTKENVITMSSISPSLARTLLAGRARDLHYLPTTDSDFHGVIE